MTNNIYSTKIRTRLLQGLLFLIIAPVACSHSASAKPDSNGNDTTTGLPTSHPSSQPSHQTNSVKTGNEPASLVASHWDNAEFNQGINPSLSHRPNQNQAVAIFAGGCFWCMEAPFEKLPGVTSVISGYTGGQIEAPTYSMVSRSETKHLEAVLVFYQPQQISYDRLLYTYWRSINPTQTDGQFADRGLQYTTAIFTVDALQEKAAQQSKQQLSSSGKFSTPIAVKIEPAQVFWPAEDYHQNYYKTNESHYLRYKYGSGRAGYLKHTWGDD